MAEAARGRVRGGLAAFGHRGFPAYWGMLLATGFALQIQIVAVFVQVWETTAEELHLGLVGLSQFAPAAALVVVTGTVADQFSRRRIMAVCLVAMTAAALGFVLLTLGGSRSVLPIFALLAAFGAARAFYNPARQAIVPNLVPAETLPNAITINTQANQVAMVAGPVVGGLLYGVAPVLAYGTAAALFALGGVLALLIPRPPERTARGAPGWDALVAGFSYIRRAPVVLGAISLDLFAVILGGAVALLPVYATDILHIGPMGLGFLRAGPAVGAILVGMLLMAFPIRDHAGRLMFAAVAVFGLATVVFAWSTAVWLSLLSLVVLGGADMVSVYIRGTLIQLWTPDDLRGRVNAVNQVFIGASNEVGAFRAGTMGALIGPVAAVGLGGLGAIGIAALWWRLFPALAHIRHLGGPEGR